MAVISAIAGALALDAIADADLARLQIVNLPVSGQGQGVLAQGRARLVGTNHVADGVVEVAEARVAPRRAILRRDAIGVRPLYYACSCDGRRFAFASSLAQLECLPWVDHSIDPDGLLDTFCPAGDDPSRTCIAGIRQVPAGHSVEWGAGGSITLKREWQAERFLWNGGPAPRNAAAEFAQRLVHAVARRCHSETAILLSGGLDSTSVAAAAVRAGRHPATLSAVYPEFPSADESAGIVATRAVLDLAGESMTLEDRGLDTIDRELDIHGHPTGAPNYGNFLALLEQAARRGFASLLDGHDGDSALGSMQRLTPYLLTRPRLAIDVIRATAATGTRPAQVLRGWVLELARPALQRATAARARNPDTIPLWVGPELRERLLKISQLTWLEAQAAAVNLLASRAFPVLDCVAAACGIELAHPYADRELLEFLLSLPPEAKYAGGRPKALVREGFPELPAVVRAQTKLTFTEPAAAANPFARVAKELRSVTVPAPGIDYSALHARLTEGPPYRHWEQALMRWLAACHRYLARRNSARCA